MKKYLLIVMICLLITPFSAIATAAQSQNSLTFVTPEGAEYIVVLPEGGAYISGYKNENGKWVTQFSGQCIGDYDPGFLRRHDTKSARPDGSFYPDDLGFDYVSSRSGAWDSYHFDGKYFSLSGWYDPEYNGHVMVKGLTLEYYPMGSKSPEYTVTAADEDTLSNWTHLERPLTPEMARACAAIQKSAVANAYPGYTLCSYSAYSIGKLQADALYCRIEDGILHSKVVFLDPGQPPLETDLISVPLSQNVLAMGKEAIFTALSEYGDWGLVHLSPTPLDSDMLSLHGKLIDLDIQSEGLIALSSDEKGGRRISIITLDEQGTYKTKTTRSLPADAHLDTFHSSTGELEIEWNEQSQQAGYALSPQGDWQLSWVMSSTEEGSVDYSVSFYRVQLTRDRRFIGSLPGFSLWETDLNALPKNEKELKAAMDRAGWAVVNNPNPADRLHLREKADRSSDSLGKFYNGTPVKILKKQGDWYQVQIGQVGLTGWMMKKYLTEGMKMDAVRPAFPDLVLKSPYYENAMVYSKVKGAPDFKLNGSYDIMGVYQDTWYILMTHDGQIVYAPMNWFFPGNG